MEAREQDEKQAHTDRLPQETTEEERRSMTIDAIAEAEADNITVRFIRGNSETGGSPYNVAGLRAAIASRIRSLVTQERSRHSIAVAAEREACAQICLRRADRRNEEKDWSSASEAQACAKAIRRQVR